MNSTRIRTLTFSLLIISIGSTHAATVSNLSDIPRSDYEDHTIPVIVELKIPNQSMSRAKRSGGWINLGAHLESLQDQAIQEFGWRNLKVGAIYEVTPQIALETNRAGFSTIIKQNSEAEMVLDENRLPLQNNRPNPGVVHLGQLTVHRQ